jgi:ectoine hydroxylase-related dioxygenase (phytanoyl-CoA dioxygenase family)
MSAIVRLSSEVSPEQVAQVIHLDGACIVEDLVPVELLDRVSEEIRPFVEKTPGGNTDFGGFVTRRTGGLAGRSRSARDLIMHPLILAAGKQILAETMAMQLMNTEIISIGPSETLQPLHRDQDAWPFPFPPGYEPEFSVMWPLNTDFTKENGATRLVVGSHRKGTIVNFDGMEVQQAVMRRGSVLLWTGSVYHGGGANHTSEIREGVNIAYAVGWLRQEENQYLAVPFDVAATLDDDLLRLMGYDKPAISLGNAADRSHPLGVFRPELAHPGAVDVKAARQRYPVETAESETRAQDAESD